MTSVTVLPSGDVPGAELVWTIVVAGGTGERFGAAKQYEPLGERRRVIDHHADGGRTRRPMAWSSSCRPPTSDARAGVAGGATRSESVRAGLAAVPAEATIICVHDAARPLATRRSVRLGDRRGSRRRRRRDSRDRGDRHDQGRRTAATSARQRRTGRPWSRCRPRRRSGGNAARCPRAGRLGHRRRRAGRGDAVAESSWLPGSRPTGRSPNRTISSGRGRTIGAAK